jgi:hypothetical protein
MFENVRIPKWIDSPINEAVFEIRYKGPYPGKALCGGFSAIFLMRQCDYLDFILHEAVY